MSATLEDASHLKLAKFACQCNSCISKIITGRTEKTYVLAFVSNDLLLRD